MAAVIRSRLVKIFLLIFILLAVFAFLQFFSENRIVVARVIDGDTIGLRNGQRVRLLGIDATEKGQYYHDEATGRLRQLVEGKRVTLEKDVSNRDRYGRLLRYVYSDGLFVNLEMIKEGYAILFTTPKNVKHLNEFMRAEEEAKTKGIGVWSLVKS
jgi:micrococcal nuclease